MVNLAEKGRRLLHQMIRIRRFEEKCAELYQSLKIRGFLHLCIGEEAVSVGVVEALQEQDALVATYREHGQALARGISMDSVMAEMYGKVEGCSRGRGGSMHLFDAKTRFYGGNAIVGGGLPIAVGLALADRMRGTSAVTCCFFGDGAVAEGEFHESLNLAALWKLPVLFVCENNLYAMGTALSLTQSVTDLVSKVAGYGVNRSSVDGMDVLAVEAASRRAVESIRAGEGPYFLECQTYRFKPHSMFDAGLYRDKEEVEEWKKRDPIKSLIDQLHRDDQLDDQDLKDLEDQVDREVEQAVEFAEAGAWEPLEDLTRFVTADRISL